MAVQHHLDQPLMQINEIDISPGFETQIAVSPTLYTTTEAAKTRFSPRERGCYSDREVMLKHLPYGMYRWAAARVARLEAAQWCAGTISGTACSRPRMTRCWTGAAAPPTNTGGWSNSPQSSSRGHSVK